VYTLLYNYVVDVNQNMVVHTDLQLLL